MLVRTRTVFGGLAGVAIVVLAGCGGGGGGSDPAPAPAPASGNISNVTFDGTAAKGIINLGNVIADELDASGTVIAQVGSAITGVDGSYSLSVDSNYTGGPVRITISADANTQMKCDVPAGCGTRTDGIADSNDASAIDFGEWYKPGAGNLTMTALVAEAATGDSIGVSITPYTHLAASRAMEAGSLSAAGIYNANSEVSNLLGGIDILNTRPLDITNSGGGTETEIAYAAFSAAIATLADTDGSGAPDIDGALAVLSSSFSGGTIIADDGGTNDSIISLQEIINGALSTLGQAGIGDTSGTIAKLQTDVDDASGGNVDPQPSPTTGGTALARVKAFVSDVRTWGTVIEEETSAKGEAFGTQIDLASTAADLSMELVIGPVLGSAIDAVFMHITGTAATDLSEYEVGFPGDPQFTAGTIAYSNGVATITNGLVDGVTVNMSVQLPADGLTATSNLTIDITSATLISNSSELTINRGTMVISLATPYLIDYEIIDAGSTSAEPDISGASVNLDVMLTQKKDESGAMLASSVTFAGTLSTTLAKPVEDDTTGKIIWITPATLTLTGNISDTAGNSLDASFTANISNAGTFEPVGDLAIDTVRDDLVTWAYAGDTFTLASPDATLTIQWDSSSGAATITEMRGHGYSNRYVSTGSYTDIVDAVARSGSPLNWYSVYGLYAWIDDEGGYFADLGSADFSTDGTASGKLFDPDFVVEDADNWLAGTVGLSFTLQLAGLPEASVNISGERTEFKAGTATVTIAYDRRKIVIAGAFSNMSSASRDMSSTGSVTITNQDSVVMVIDGDFKASTGDIKYNGQSYGSITQMSNGLTKITYIDGTFETL